MSRITLLLFNLILGYLTALLPVRTIEYPLPFGLPFETIVISDLGCQFVWYDRSGMCHERRMSLAVFLKESTPCLEEGEGP